MGSLDLLLHPYSVALRSPFGDRLTTLASGDGSSPGLWEILLETCPELGLRRSRAALRNCGRTRMLPSTS